ncbi:MAG: DUF4292 domain-containing protein [Bacteroidales bacterium]
MYRTQKIIAFTLIIVFSVTGCTVSRQLTSNKDNNFDINKILLNTYSKNLTDIGFYIQKGRLTVKEGKRKINFYYSIKYKRENIYLISIRALNGHEAVRIFLNNDTILVNDRINNELLYGKNADFERLTGIPVEFLKVCVGDILDYSKGIVSNVSINGRDVVIKGFIKGLEITTNISSDRYKVSSLRMANISKEEEITIEYENFKGENHLIPEEIRIYDSQRKVELKMKNLKYIIPWYGDIDFIPGLNFKKRHI